MTMVKTALRIGGGLIALYLVIVLAVYVLQTRIFFPAPQDLHDPAPGYEAVTLTTRDGLELMAHWRAPAADQPTVVHFHGNAGSLAGATAENKELAARGFGVLLVEYRGYGGNPGSPSEEGFYEDGRAALAFLVSQSIPPAKTILKGHSIGTGTATQLARETQAGGLILVAPFTSLPAAGSAALPVLPMGLLVTNRFDNLAKLPALTLPILVQHGTGDTTIPYTQGEALAASNPRAELQSLDGADHNLTMDQTVQAAQAEWVSTLGLVPQP